MNREHIKRALTILGANSLVQVGICRVARTLTGLRVPIGLCTCIRASIWARGGAVQTS